VAAPARGEVGGGKRQEASGEIDCAAKNVLVISREGIGFARTGAEASEVLVRIPMAGTISSWNVSAASARGEAGGGTRQEDCGAIDYTAKNVLVFDGEGIGFARTGAEGCDVLVRTPMAGTISSLNVSVAASGGEVGSGARHLSRARRISRTSNIWRVPELRFVR